MKPVSTTAITRAASFVATAARPAIRARAPATPETGAEAAPDGAIIERTSVAETDPARVDLNLFNRADLIEREPHRTSLPARMVKRGLDVALALALLIAFAPLMALAAIAVKIDSPGPVFYRQKRTGVGGKEFWIIKFRSMREDAERDGARWAARDDDRITRVGAFLRKYRIDEMPQAFNVLLNDMSFVGPRPERPEFVQLLEREIPHYAVRHRVKPGITGWAQVNREYGASVEDAREKLTYDLFYIKNYSPFLDVWVVLKTVRVALFGVGSR